MEISNSNFTYLDNTGISYLSKNQSRQKNGPLDASAVFKSLTDLKYYIIGTYVGADDLNTLSNDAEVSSVFNDINNNKSTFVSNLYRYAYVGQIISIVDEDNSNKVDMYQILNVPRSKTDVKAALVELSNGLNPLFKHIANEDDIQVVTDKISTNIFIRNYDENGNVINAYSNLSVIKLTDAEYNQLIYTGEIYKLSNAIFIVSSDIIDAHQMQIRNMADGTAPDDAVTLKQLNDASSSSHSDFTSALTSTVDSLSVGQITLSSSNNPVSVITEIKEISGKISISASTLTQSMVQNLTTDLGNISNEVSTKIFVKNFDQNDIPISDYTNLSVVKITESEYNELIYTGEIYKLSNVIFVVSSDIVNAYGMQIRNVADGTALDDAVTLKQLNAISSGSHSDFTSALTSTIDSLKVDQITLSSSNSPISVITAVDEISGKISISASTLTQSMVQNLTTDLGNISNEVSTKIWIDNPEDGVNAEYTNLSVRKMTKEEYDNLSSYDPKTLYVVSSDVWDVNYQKIVNVTDGTNPNDAVNLRQLQSAAAGSHGDFTSALTAAIDSLSVSTITLTPNGSPVSVITSIGEVSGKVSITGAPLSESMVQNLVTDLNTLSNQISTKVFIKNYDDNGNPLTAYDNLSVVKIPDSEYEELVLMDELSSLSNTVFILSSNFVNAYGMQIKNLADGTHPDDAVNLRQLNAVSSQLPTGVIEMSAEISTKVYVQNQMLSDYVGTLSILQIPRDEFYALLPDGVQPNALYLVSSDTINAYGQRMENLGNAVHDTDAINKGQAIEIIENAVDNISRNWKSWISEQLSASLGDYEDLENVDWEHISIETVIDMVKFIYSKMGAGKVTY